LEISLQNFKNDLNKKTNQEPALEQINKNKILDASEQSKPIAARDPEVSEKKIRMKVKIIKNQETLLEEDFFNTILINNFIFENPNCTVLTQTQDPKSNKNQNQQVTLPNKDLSTYYIICSFELSEFDKHRNLIDKDNPDWIIRIFSSETLYFCKDTSKEDREKAVKDSWENIERGRSEFAKTSRLRFLGISKTMRGEALSPEEEKIVNTERVKKITQSHDHFAVTEKINNVGKKTLNNAADFKIKSPTNNVQLSKNNIVPEPIPNDYAKYEKLELRPIKIKPEDHSSYYIRNFINYSTRERTITKGQHIAQSQSSL